MRKQDFLGPVFAFALALLTASTAETQQATPPADDSPPKAENGTPPADDEQMEQIERTVRDALDAVLQRLQDLIETIPRYEAPEILENGDIIIRRIRPKIIEDERNRLYQTSAPSGSGNRA